MAIELETFTRSMNTFRHLLLIHVSTLTFPVVCYLEKCMYIHINWECLCRVAEDVEYDAKFFEFHLWL